MRLKDVGCAEKTVTDWGRWQSGKMPRSAFPLSMSRQNFYRLGAYRWKVVRFGALGETFRLLIALHEPKEQFRAMLGMDVGSDTRFIASIEFHGTHPGWHALLACDPVDTLPIGIKTGPWQTRVPAARSHHRRTAFAITERTATAKAGSFFGLVAEDSSGDQREMDL